MRKLWRRLVFALTPQHKRLYQLQMYSIERGVYVATCTGEQQYIEYLAYCARVNRTVHRVVRIK